jgi:hypothetical protein
VQSKSVARLDKFGKSPKNMRSQNLRLRICCGGLGEGTEVLKVGRVQSAWVRTLDVAKFTRKGHAPHENALKSPPGPLTLDNKGAKAPKHRTLPETHLSTSHVGCSVGR